ncbi:MAG: HAD-IA family hydrolase [Gammaproteobacteria bacterium]|jgi:phosphoglycolate phosphatase
MTNYLDLLKMSNLPYKLLIFDWEGTLANPQTLGATQLFDDTLSVLTDLHQQGYLLAIATAKSKAGLAQDLIKTGLDKIIDATCTAQESEPKPNPAMLFMILDELAITPQDALMIGDTIFDLAMGQDANMDTLAVTSGVQTCEELLEYQPIDCIEIITELPNWLLNLRKK